MPLVSRDRITRAMQGDAFGSVSERSRFAVGDPGLFGFLGRGIKKGAGFLGAAVKQKLGIPAATKPSTTLAVKRIASGLPATTGGIQRFGGKVGTPERPAVIQIGGTKVAFPTDPLGIGAALGLGVGAAGRRRRRMNPLNPRALRRSMRRVQSFARFAQRTISFTKRVRMKRRRRRAA